MIKNRGDKWTENEISLAKELYLKGCSFSEIALKTNHSECAATKKIQDLELNNRKILWTDKDIETLKDLFNKGLSYSDISKTLNKSVRSCQGKAVRLGLKKKDCNTWKNNKRTDFWTNEEVEKLIYCANNYTSYSEISKIMGRSIKSISCKLSELGKHLKEKTDIEKANYRRAYSVDDNYFEIIDSQKKAYWLGWLITDGYVVSKLNTKRQGVHATNHIGLHLQKSDYSILEELKTELKATYPISTRESRVYKGKNGKTVISKESCTFEFSSAKMIQDLAKYGIHQNKTYDVVFPKKLDSKYYPGFIAGVISGDGCIDIKKNRKGFILRCTIAGTLDLVQKIREIFIKEICFNSEKKISKYESSKCLYRLELNQTEAIALYYWLQKNGISLMERKNKLIEEFINERVKIPA